MKKTSLENANAHVSEDGTRTQTIRDHLQHTADMASRFAAPFGASEMAYLAGLLHDIGKYSAAFQRRLAGSPERVDHATAGATEAFALHQREIAFAVAGHHGGLPDGGSKVDSPDAATLFGRLRRRVEPYDRWRAEITLPVAPPPLDLPANAFTRAFFIRMLYSCLVDADYLDTEAFMEGTPPPRGGQATMPQLLEKLRADVAQRWKADSTLDVRRDVLNKRRSTILRACFDRGSRGGKGLYTLTVPTGGGKTVSSLAFALSLACAEKMERVIYVIPYTSIIDQTAAKFAEILGSEAVLEHHAGADYRIQENDDPAAYRKGLAAENWDVPVVVTTAVQFFESLFANRSSRCRKLHNLANSVIIFDEAQTLPVSYLRPCVAAIAQLVRHYGAAAVLCTATPPALGPLFAEFAPDHPLQEICPDPAGQYAFFRRTHLRQLGEQSIPVLTERLRDAPQVLCVVNRRRTARELYAALDEDGCYCLTTLLCPLHRKRLFADMRKRLNKGLPCRVVATSLIEAGVDVDFPVAYREEAGLDSIIQTAGRCNRENTHEAADSPVYIFRLQDQAPPSMLEQNIASAQHVLRAFADPTGLDAIESYFTFYRKLKGDAALDKEGVLDAFARGFSFATVAEQFHLIESPTCTVYIPFEEGAAWIAALRQGQYSRALFRKLGQVGVNVYPEHLNALERAGLIEWLGGETAVLTDMHAYDDCMGLSLDIEAGIGYYA